MRVIMRWIVRLATGIACAGVMMLTIIVCYEVFTRYVLGRPTIWVGEISSYMVIWVGLFSVVVALAEEKHIRVDLIFAHFSPKVQAGLNIFTALLMLALAGIILWNGWIYFWEAYSRGWEHYGMLYLPMSYTRIAIPLVGLILCAQIILKIYDYIRAFRGKVS